MLIAALLQNKSTENEEISSSEWVSVTSAGQQQQQQTRNKIFRFRETCNVFSVKSTVKTIVLSQFAQTTTIRRLDAKQDIDIKIKTTMPTVQHTRSTINSIANKIMIQIAHCGRFPPKISYDEPDDKRL
jgi:hypothetical protein